MKTELARLANGLYDRAPALHRFLYARYKQWSDRAERALLRTLVHPGNTVLDVGANIGIYTEFLAALVGPSGRVIAFEPEPRNVQRLRSATRDLRQVTVVHAGVGPRSGTLRLFVADDLNVDHRTYETDDPSRRVIEVRAIALDEYLSEQGSRVDVIKMDIQGAEIGALQGARQLLARPDAPALLLEYWPHGLRAAGVAPESLLSLLAEAGYRVRTVDGSALPQPTSDDPSDYTNIVATKA
jgi:FkbM family methyltransferase